MAKRTASANGKYARRKGINFELDIVKIFKEFYPEAHRLLECQGGLGHDIGNRPLLILGMLLILVGIQLFTIGIVADLLMRTYYESQDKKPYNIRKITTIENE